MYFNIRFYIRLYWLSYFNFNQYFLIHFLCLSLYHLFGSYYLERLSNFNYCQIHCRDGFGILFFLRYFQSFVFQRWQSLCFEVLNYLFLEHLRGYLYKHEIDEQDFVRTYQAIVLTELFWLPLLVFEKIMAEVSHF